MVLLLVSEKYNSKNAVFYIPGIIYQLTTITTMKVTIALHWVEPL